MKGAFALLVLGWVMCMGASAIPCSEEAEFLFEAVCEWTSESHPTDYPTSSVDFSQMCGTVHNDVYRIWSVGGTASPAVKEIAELGNCGPLEQEVTECEAAGNCAGDGYFALDCESPTENPTVCTFSGNVTLTEGYSRISMLSMIFPSPDWNIGIDSLELCQRDENGNGEWLEQYPQNGTIGLFAIDAGTDAGATYTANNEPLSVFEPIAVYDAEDASNIFFNPNLNAVLPICEVTVTLVE